MSDRNLATALDECVRAIRAGDSLADCVGRYPALRSELEPLLQHAIALQAQPSASRNTANRHAARAELMTAIRTESRQKGGIFGLPGTSVRPQQVEGHPRPGFLGFLDGLPRLALVPVIAVLIAAVLVVAQGLPFSNSDVAEAETVLSVLQGPVFIESKAGLVPALDGMKIRENDRVITRADGRAVLTFFDGSTVTLEPDTRLVIKRVRSQNRRLILRLLQEQGRTWTHILENRDAADVKIETPDGAAETSQGGTFETTISGGRTEVTAGSGPVSVQSGDNRADVPGGSRAGVDAPGTVTTPSVAPEAAHELVIRIRGADFVHLTDPTGSTIGVVPPGVPVNQISGASMSRPAEGVIVLRLPNPADGAYRLSARSESNGVIGVEALIRGGGADTPVAAFAVAATETWLVRFGVEGVTIRPQAFVRELQPVPPAVIPNDAADRVQQTATPVATRPPQRPTQPPASTATPVPTQRPPATTRPSTPVSNTRP